MNEDGELQDRELTRLYREAAREQPSVELDARMLAAARAASRRAAAPAAASWLNSWRIPVALAATVLLSFTLTLLVREGEDGRLAAPEQSIGAPRPAQNSTGAESMTRTVAPVPAAPPSARLPPPVQGPARPRPAAPAAGGQTGTGPAASGGESTRQTAPKADTFVADPAAGVAGNLSPERKAMRSAPEAPASEGSRPAIMKDQAAREKARPEAAAMQPALSASAPERADRSAPAIRSAEQWLADIRKLKQEGKNAEAEAGLAEFRRRFPQYALPGDLQ